MSSFDKRLASGGTGTAQRPVVTWTVIAFASMAVMSGNATAEDELLQFEQVAPASPASEVAADARPFASQLGRIGAGASKADSTSVVVRSVRESLAIPVSDGLLEDVLVFERLPLARVDMPNVTSETAPSAAEALVAPIVRLSTLLPAPGAVAQGAPGTRKGEVPEAELRSMFLSVVDAASGRSPAVAGALAQHAASKADISEARGQRYPQLDISARGLSVSLAPAPPRGPAIRH